MNFKYEKFEDWFNELEGFGLRSERFYEMFGCYSGELVSKWLRASFESARETEEPK